MIDPRTGKRIYPQVKKGETPLNRDDYAKLKGEVWLLTTKGQITGRERKKIFVADPEILYEFAMSQEAQKVLPRSILKWCDFLKKHGKANKPKEELKMTSKANTHLFKERINKSNGNALAVLLTAAIRAGEEELKRLLFDDPNPEEYRKHGRYQVGGHKCCSGRSSGASSENSTEKQICRCMYYRNSEYRSQCNDCALIKLRRHIAGEYRIIDYEVPSHYYGDGIGEIDLLIGDGETTYATEVKPPKGNSETLLRMVAEIMTYTAGNQEGYKKAIGFFEDSDQDTEYVSISPEMELLLREADITVFRFVEEGDEGYRICKL